MWNLRRNKDDEGFLRRLANSPWRQARGFTAPVIDKEPKLFDDLTELWHSWHTLTLGRPMGEVPQGLSWVEISTYATDHGMPTLAKLRFCRLIKALDAAWLAEMYAKLKAKHDKGRSTRAKSRRDPTRPGAEDCRDGTREDGRQG